MKTGVVLRKLRSVRDGKETQLVTEYEINTALIECLNSVERRAAIETGQESTGRISTCARELATKLTCPRRRSRSRSSGRCARGCRRPSIRSRGNRRHAGLSGAVGRP